MGEVSDDLGERLQHAEHRQLYAYWSGKCRDGALPARADIDPIDLRRQLPRIALIDVLREPGGLQFRYRLTGTEIVERSGRDPTGKRFDELYRGAYLQTALDTYRRVVETGRPELSERTYPLVPDREYLHYDRLILPLAADGQTVDMVLLNIVVLEHRRVEPES
jgi:hypothetical protein